MPPSSGRHFKDGIDSWIIVARWNEPPAVRCCGHRRSGRPDRRDTVARPWLWDKSVERPTEGRSSPALAKRSCEQFCTDAPHRRAHIFGSLIVDRGELCTARHNPLGARRWFAKRADLLAQTASVWTDRTSDMPSEETKSKEQT